METIICLSSQKWDDPLWTNKQHIMSRLAKHHRVIHVDYGLRPAPLYLWRRLKQRPQDALSPLRTLTDGVLHRGGNLYTADHISPLCAGAFKHGSFVRDRSTFDLKILYLQRFLKREGISDPIVWVYHPGYGDAVDLLPKKLLVYDCVDNYMAFPAYRDDPGWLQAREERLCRKADLVFTTSEGLFKKRRHLNPDHTHLVHNVGDATHFGRARDPQTKIPQEIAAIRVKGPVVGFVGAVSDYKLNMRWLLHAARQRPEWQFVLIGPVGEADPGTDASEAMRQPNMHFIGLREYRVLPEYIKGFDACVIPYKINEYTEYVFPIKFFEFMATGKPLVVSKLPALNDYLDAVRWAEDEDGFVRELDAALAAPEEGMAARVALADANSWDSRVNALWGHVERRLAERAAR
jgi:glycosyltransferase involved in cell wall biosynthesis